MRMVLVMKCKNCPLDYTPYEGEFNSDPMCRIFGYRDHELCYEDENCEEGCYLDWHYIQKVAKEKGLA